MNIINALFHDDDDNYYNDINNKVPKPKQDMARLKCLAHATQDKHKKEENISRRSNTILLK